MRFHAGAVGTSLKHLLIEGPCLVYLRIDKGTCQTYLMVDKAACLIYPCRDLPYPCTSRNLILHHRTFAVQTARGIWFAVFDFGAYPDGRG
eukprot:820720-Rhodomonas_salina.1